MKNKILMSGKGARMSLPMNHVEAERRLKLWQQTTDKDAYLEDTDEAVKSTYVSSAPAEVVEDIGCASGACTL